MADIYVRSTDGNNADSGATWALAKLDLAGAAAIDVAGDTIYVSDNHAESTAAAITIALAGTLASPVRVICGDDSAQPPTSAATTGTVTTTGTSSITISGNIYVYGLTFNCGTGSGNPAIGLGSVQQYERCQFRLLAGSGASIDVANTDETRVTWVNCDVSFSHSNQGLAIGRAGVFIWNGGSVASGSTAQSVLIRTLGSLARGSLAEISGVDLQHIGASCNLVTNSVQGAYSIVFRNCRLPTSWSGNLLSGAVTEPAFRVAMYNCDSGDTNYRIWTEALAGSVVSETTIVRSGGASDGTTSLSWKMVSNANAEYPLLQLESPEIVRWNETTGSSITVTVETITDNVTLTDDECWLEVQYLGTSGFPLGTFISDAKADVLATAANQTTSSETWTTTGLTTPVKQKLSVSFTPQEKGFIHAVVKLARASTTVYVCPKLDVT